MSRVRDRVKEADANGQDGWSDCAVPRFGLYSGVCNNQATVYSPSTYRMKKSSGDRLHRCHTFLRRLRPGAPYPSAGEDVAAPAHFAKANCHTELMIGTALAFQGAAVIPDPNSRAI